MINKESNKGHQRSLENALAEIQSLKIRCGGLEKSIEEKYQIIDALTDENTSLRASLDIYMSKYEAVKRLVNLTHCRRCSGKGRLYLKVETNHGNEIEELGECPDCQGAGTIIMIENM